MHPHVRHIYVHTNTPTSVLQNIYTSAPHSTVDIPHPCVHAFMHVAHILPSPPHPHTLALPPQSHWTHLRYGDETKDKQEQKSVQQPQVT